MCFYVLARFLEGPLRWQRSGPRGLRSYIRRPLFTDAVWLLCFPFSDFLFFNLFILGDIPEASPFGPHKSFSTTAGVSAPSFTPCTGGALLLFSDLDHQGTLDFFWNFGGQDSFDDTAVCAVAVVLGRSSRSKAQESSKDTCAEGIELQGVHS